MTGIILQTRAVDLVNKGGGRKCRTVGLGAGRYRTNLGDKTKGTDYVVFNCPGCGARNKRSLYDAKGSTGNTVSFKCNRCYREIEVSKPTSTPIILDANSPAQQIGLVGPDGKPINRISPNALR